MAEFIEAYWMQGLWTILLAVATGLIRKISKGFSGMKEEQDAIRFGVLSLGHDRLYQAGKFYVKRHKNKGIGISVEELRNLEYLFKAYAGLGGNGTAKELYERCKDLPIEDEGVVEDDQLEGKSKK